MLETFTKYTYNLIELDCNKLNALIDADQRFCVEVDPSMSREVVEEDDDYEEEDEDYV